MKDGENFPINAEQFVSGQHRASLEEVLAFREECARRQKALLAARGVPLLCLGINMPGEYKRFPLAERSLREEVRLVKLSLAAEGIEILHEELYEAPGGCADFISAAAPAEGLKEIALRIERGHSLGRLFDIDVLNGRGEKLSRRDSGGGPRPCLVCGGDAFACGRSRAHNAADLREAAIGIMVKSFREKLGLLVSGAAVRALVTEVAVTPKPGLVDRANNGAHRDMDFFSFIDSSAAILPCFRDCALAGFDAAAETGDQFRPEALFESLRPRGKIAEQEMLEATGGVNTHRGVIFSFGLASAAFGVLFRRGESVPAEEVLDLAGAMTALVDKDFARKSGAALSHGEAVQRRYGTGGVREEARRGFPSVRDRALPELRRVLKAGSGVNDAGLAAFLALLSVTADTNVIHRAGPDVLGELQKETAAFLETRPDIPSLREYAAGLDRKFIEKNISPGGCADLLALTLFLHRLCD
ncbi:MAG: citrate lyase holo-[acyl-carrier protein] synthase [Treponema sp.]|jgi:holo-ACP synthase/triphosphoribosyl-dephospho-CoA synthase|nr:citrate lyase holo-[acyl-carrier protein] synthase [Treponema sp.]